MNIFGGLFYGLFGDGYVLSGNAQSLYDQHENMFKQQAYNQKTYNSQQPPVAKSSSKFTDSPERIIDAEYVVIEIDGKKLIEERK